jgi:hypothetical protein
MCCPGTDNGHRGKEDVDEQEVWQSDTDVVVCPCELQPLMLGWQLLSSLLPHAEARQAGRQAHRQVAAALQDWSSQ